MRYSILTRFNLICLLAPALIAACGAPDNGTPGLQRSARGDTTILVSLGQRDTIVLDSLAIVWQSESLEAPQSMALIDSTLVVTERTRLHFLHLKPDQGNHRARTVGRQGQGPGEFSSIRALGIIKPDTAIVYDQRNQRITYLSPLGDVLGTRQVAGIATYPNAASGDQLVGWNRGILMPRSSVISLRSPVTHALLWYDPAADTATALVTWPGPRVVDFGGGIVPAEMFGPNIYVSVAGNGRVAAGDGLDYCVNLHEPGNRAITRLCRDRARTPVGKNIRNPDLTSLNPALKSVVENMLRAQTIGDALPSYDRLLWAEDGSLWVRTMGPDNADVIPILARMRPDLAPPTRFWDVFDRNGSFIETIQLPSTFAPWVVLPDAIYGFGELGSGEIVLGAVSRS